MDKKKTRLIITSGVDEAKETEFAKILEERGFSLLLTSSFSSLEGKKESDKGIVLIVPLEEACSFIKKAKADKDFLVSSIALYASYDVLLKRSLLEKEIHPKQKEGLSLEEAIRNDIEKMKDVRSSFDLYVDSGNMQKSDFSRLALILAKDKSHEGPTIIVSSFGYKYGLPIDAEIVLDARVLSNPYYVPSLKRLTGLDKEVQDYIMKDKRTTPFLNGVYSLIDMYISSYAEEGRPYLSIYVGCSGGQHRSVFVSESIRRHYENKYDSYAFHHELHRYIEEAK